MTPARALVPILLLIPVALGAAESARQPHLPSPFPSAAIAPTAFQPAPEPSVSRGFWVPRSGASDRRGGMGPASQIARRRPGAVEAAAAAVWGAVANRLRARGARR